MTHREEFRAYMKAANRTPGNNDEGHLSEAQVIEILGPPTSQQNYVTGKAWIPWYYGPDTSRLDYRYKGVGLISFSRNRYSGAAQVVRVDADPNEDGLP